MINEFKIGKAYKSLSGFNTMRENVFELVKPNEIFTVLDVEYVYLPDPYLEYPAPTQFKVSIFHNNEIKQIPRFNKSQLSDVEEII